MGAGIAGTVYLSVALIASYFLKLKTENAHVERPAYVVWLALVPVMFFTRSPMLTLVAAAVLLILTRPRPRTDLIVFFLLVLPAVPHFVDYNIPFPGINFLITLDYAKLAVLLLLLPLLLSPRRQQGPRRSDATDVMLVLYFVLTSVLSLRDQPFTSALRFAVDQSLWLVIPYFAISRALSDAADFDRLFKAIVTLGAMLACIGLVSQAVRWNIYGYLDLNYRLFGHADYRWGFLRIDATLNPPVLLGFVFAIAMQCLLYVRSEQDHRLRVLALLALLLLGIVFTFARGAWLALVVVVAAYLALSSRQSNARLIAIGLAATLPVLFMVAGDTGVLDEYDPYGTFQYRAELLRATMVQFWEAPLFGTPNFRESPHFAHLVQGQGIIDVVNSYVGVLMSSGLVGLVLFVGMFVATIVKLLRIRRRYVGDRRAAALAERKRIALVAAMIVSYLVLIATVSGVSLIPHFGIILLAIGRALVQHYSRAALAPSPARAPAAQTRVPLR